MNIRLLRVTLAGLTCATALATKSAAAELRAYNAAITESSISGISSGGYMAVQFGTAWSSVIKGVAVVAGGPYWCAKAGAYNFFTWYWWYLDAIPRATGSCMKGPRSNLNVNDFTAKANAKAASGEIDPVQNLSRQKTYIFRGYNDTVVAKAATDAAADFYRNYFGAAGRGNLYYQTTVGAGHSLVVLPKPGADGLNGCNENDSPFIDQCAYDQAGIILQYIYGALNPPNRGQLTGTIKQFDQSVYTKPDTPSSQSLADRAYVFVPKDCDDGAACRVHIALHGCRQSVDDIRRRFIDDSGYNAWADTNRLIVLYPQTRAGAANPYGCWDWWSYVTHTDNYVTKSGPQIRTIKAMLNALTAAAVPVVATPPASGVAPSALSVIDTSDTAAALAWRAVEGVTTYRIWRADDANPFTAMGDVVGPSFGDSALAPKTRYRWRVAAIVNGVEGPPSDEVIATTRSTPAPCDNPGACPIGE